MEHLSPWKLCVGEPGGRVPLLGALKFKKGRL